MIFDTEGSDNTERTIATALSTARERGLVDIVVASSTGKTAKLLMGHPDLNVVAVSHVFGFPTPGENELAAETRKDLIRAGIPVVTAAHALSAGERGLSTKFGGAYPLEIVSHTLRFFGQGTKVAIEVATMALDAGLIPFGKPVISIGGTSEGADTALILIPATSARFFDTHVQEILCKPR